MIQGRYNLKDSYFDNTKKQVTFNLPSIAEFELTGASARIEVRDKPNGTIFKVYTSESGLTITPPYQVSIDEHIVDIVAGNYVWDLKITFADLREYNLIGGSWSIKNVVTKDAVV